MKNKTVLKFLCVIAFLGLASARKFTGQLNATSLRKPNFKTNSEVIQAYWDPDFCSYWEDNDVFINPEDCSGYLICWNGELLEMWCEPGMLFNPVDLFCDPKDEVQCLDGSWPPPGQDDDLCPPAGSNEVRFLPSNNCNEFYICMNGNPVLLECRPGQHWNIYEEFCDDPEFAGCDVSFKWNSFDTRLLIYDISISPTLLGRVQIDCQTVLLELLVRFHIRTTVTGSFTATTETEASNSVNTCIILMWILADVCSWQVLVASNIWEIERHRNYKVWCSKILSNGMAFNNSLT